MTDTSPLRAIWRRWWIVLLMAVFGAVAGALPEPERVEEQVRVFEATNTSLLNDVLGTDTESAIVSPSQVSLFVTTGEVPSRVADQLGFVGNSATLASQVTSTFDADTGALTITTEQSSAEMAELVSNTFADELNSYLAERQDITYQTRLTSSDERLQLLRDELTSVAERLTFLPDDAVLLAQLDSVSRQYSVVFEQNALLQENPPLVGFTTLQAAQAVEVTDRGLGAPSSRISRALLGAIVGATLGAGIALVLGRLDRRLRTRQQAEAVMDMRARVMIPKVRDSDRDELIVGPGRNDPLSDSYRTVRNVVGFVQGPVEPGTPARITLIVSPGPGDGKTSLAANLAAAMAENGQRTILVNTDFRRPRLAAALHAERLAQSPFMLDDLDKLDAKILLESTDDPRLLLFDLSPIGGPAGDLVRATISKLPELTQLADAIVIDSSPVGATAEVLELLPHADVIVVVARVGHTLITAAQRTVAILRDLATVPLILVLAGVKLDRANYYEYTSRAPARSGRFRKLRKKPHNEGDDEDPEVVAELETAE